MLRDLVPPDLGMRTNGALTGAVDPATGLTATGLTASERASQVEASVVGTYIAAAEQDAASQAAFVASGRSTIEAFLAAQAQLEKLDAGAGSHATVRAALADVQRGVDLLVEPLTLAGVDGDAQNSMRAARRRAEAVLVGVSSLRSTPVEDRYAGNVDDLHATITSAAAVTPDTMPDVSRQLFEANQHVDRLRRGDGAADSLSRAFDLVEQASRASAASDDDSARLPTFLKQARTLLTGATVERTHTADTSALRGELRTAANEIDAAIQRSLHGGFESDVDSIMSMFERKLAQGASAVR